MHRTPLPVHALGLALFCAWGCATTPPLPGWVSSPYEDFAKGKYVVAVGSGPDRDAAKRDALADIAAFLGVQVTATSGVSESETITRSGRKSSSSGKLRAEESVNQTIGEKLSSVVIERSHREGGTIYVLAVLDKQVFLSSLSAEADNAARVLVDGIAAARAQSRPAQSMLRTLQATAQRLEGLQARTVSLGGTVSAAAARALRDALGYLAAFDIGGPPSAEVAAAALCDPEDVRWKKAAADTAALAGHPVVFHLAVEQLPKDKAFCERLFERFAGLVPKDLAMLKARDADAFAHGAPALKRIDFEYDGTLPEPTTTFDRASGRLRVVMTARSDSPLPRWVVSGPLTHQHEEVVGRRYAEMEPEAVPLAEAAKYFERLTRNVRSSYWEGDNPQALANDETAVVLLKVLRFLPVASQDAKVSTAARDWLCDRTSFFASTYNERLATLKKVPGDAPFRRAEGAWIDWLNAAFVGLPDASKLAVLTEVLQANVASFRAGTWNDLAFPGVKTYEMGLGIIDRWRKDGHPVGDKNLDDDQRERQRQLFNAIASPTQQWWNGVHVVSGSTTNKSWYAHALRSEATRQRLLRDVLARKDDVFTETALANLLAVVGMRDANAGDPWGEVMLFWRGLQADERAWTVATRVIADTRLSGKPQAVVYEEVTKLWRQPRLRGPLLYVLARLSRDDNELVPWKEFGHVFGAPISAREAAAFLDLGPRAVGLLPVIWRGLAPGWSRAELLLPRLARFAEDPLTREIDANDPAATLNRVIGHMRADGNDADAASLLAYLKKRVADHPSEERHFRKLLQSDR